MPDDDSKKALTGLEIFKTMSTFISSVVIAITGIYVTNQYNSRQLEISQRQAESQIAIARNKELADLIPKLGSSDVNIRKFSAISLALYGKDAVPALIAALGDDDQNVRDAAVKSLGIIGTPATPELIKVYQNKRNPYNLRATAVYTLGFMQAPGAYDIAVSALEDPREDPTVRKDAAAAMGFLKEGKAVEKLFSVLRKSKDRDTTLAANIVWALGEIPDASIANELVNLRLLEHFNEEVRFQTVWAIGKVGNENMVSHLSGVESRDSSERVRQAARGAAAWIKLRG